METTFGTLRTLLNNSRHTGSSTALINGVLHYVDNACVNDTRIVYVITGKEQENRRLKLQLERKIRELMLEPGTPVVTLVSSHNDKLVLRRPPCKSAKTDEPIEFVVFFASTHATLAQLLYGPKGVIFVDAYALAVLSEQAMQRIEALVGTKEEYKTALALSVRQVKQLTEEVTRLSETFRGLPDESVLRAHYRRSGGLWEVWWPGVPVPQHVSVFETDSVLKLKTYPLPDVYTVRYSELTEHFTSLVLECALCGPSVEMQYASCQGVYTKTMWRRAGQVPSSALFQSVQPAA